MKELKGHESQRHGSRGRRDRKQVPPRKPERTERPIASTRRREASNMMQKSGEILRQIKSLFGIVPTFLERQEDVRAVLTYRPSDHCQAYCPFSFLHSHPNPVSDQR